MYYYSSTWEGTGTRIVLVVDTVLEYYLQGSRLVLPVLDLVSNMVAIRMVELYEYSCTCIVVVQY